MDEQFTIAASRCAIGASVGIAAYPDDGTDAAAVVDHADKSMYQDKTARKAAHRAQQADHLSRVSRKPAAEKPRRAPRSTNVLLRHLLQADGLVGMLAVEVDDDPGERTKDTTDPVTVGGESRRFPRHRYSDSPAASRASPLSPSALSAPFAVR